MAKLPLDIPFLKAIIAENKCRTFGYVMIRASARTQRELERRYPIRLRIAVPPGGFGRQLEIMHAWLDETCSAEGWATAPAGETGIINDAIALYFADAAFANAFLDRFCCGYRVETIGGAFIVRADMQHTRRAASVHKTP
jgi:hypothetical protein